MFRMIICLLLAAPLCASGQSRRAFNLMEKEKYDQAFELLYKSVEKDSLACEAKYALSIYYFEEANPYFDYEKAHHYIVESIEDFTITDEKERDKLRKDDIDSMVLQNQKQLIENFAFYQTRKRDKLEDYLAYLASYPGSPKFDSAIWYRDLRAYQRTKQTHTWEAYQNYAQQYAESVWKDEAIAKYDTLIYEDRTRDRKYRSLVTFLDDYPETPFRKRLESDIFDIATGDHTVASYRMFIERYPDSYLRSKAVKRMVMIDSSLAVSGINQDSLAALKDRNKQSLFLGWSNGQYTFQSSEFVLDNAFTWVPEDYKCNQVTTALLLVGDDSGTRVISRLGDEVFRYDGMTSIREMGAGFVAFKTNEGWGVFLCDGALVVPPSFSEVRLLQQQYIAVKNDHWGLYAVNGKKLIPPSFEVLENVHELIKIGSIDRFGLVQPAFFLPYLDNETNEIHQFYTDLEMEDDERLLLYQDAKQGLYTSELQPLIEPASHTLTPLPVGILAEDENGVRVLMRETLIDPTRYFDEVDYTTDWLMLKNDSTWSLYSAVEDTLYAAHVDSLKILNEQAIQIIDDTVALLLNTGVSISYPKDVTLSIVAAPPAEGEERTYYYQFDNTEKTFLLNSDLDTIWVEKDSKIAALGNQYLLFSEKSKRGLLDAQGRELLDAEFDGIANYNHGAVTLLKDGALGLYHHEKNVYIPAEYHRSPAFYSDTLLTVFKEGAFGIVDPQNNVILELEYENIAFFNDSVAWVQKNNQWSLQDIFSGNLLLANVVSFSTHDDGFHYFETTRGRGVANAKTGMLIQGSFTEIQKKGTTFDPLFVTELFVNEAGLYIQVIYDAHGSILFRHAYPEQDYEHVICEN